jgi:hypothetical protein
MKLILKYGCGAETTIELSDGAPVPPVIHIESTPECANFYFVHSDELPSGAQVFQELTKEEAQEIVRGLMG